MASWMMAPSHFLKQCGLIIKLINKVLQHLSQWIITKDLKIPISKMRLKLVGLDNFNSSPEIINSFSSDNSFLCFMVVSWYLMSPSLILLASVYSRGTRYPPHVSFVTTPQGAMSQEHTCYMRSQSHERSWPPLLKLKFGNGWLTSKCCSSSCKKIQFRFSIPIPIPGISIPIAFSIPPISIPIPELELELTCNSNSGIELTPTLAMTIIGIVCIRYFRIFINKVNKESMGNLILSRRKTA